MGIEEFGGEQGSNETHASATDTDARLAHDPSGWDWMLDPPCKPSDLATVESGAHIHYRHDLTRRELQRALVMSIQTEHSSQRRNPPLKTPGCIRLPERAAGRGSGVLAAMPA